MRTRNTTQRSGFTVLEVAISTTIMAFVAIALGMIQLRSQNSFRHTSAQSQAENTCRRAAARALAEMTGLAISRLVPDPTSSLGTDTLVFQRPASVSAVGAVTWSNQMRVSLVMDTGEVDNGLDDDGDRLVDERRLVLTRGVDTANPRAVTLCHGVAEWFPGETGNGADDNANGLVDERGFSVRRMGDLLMLRLAVEVPHSDGEIASWTVDTAVRLHN